MSVGNSSVDIKFTEATTKNGLFCQFDDQNGVLLLDVKNPFSEDDFRFISKIIDPYFSEHGELGGIIINSEKFPRWSDSKSRAQYLNFARNNHYKFGKAALGVGGFFVKILTKIAQGRVHPELKIFKYNQIAKAQYWILHQ